MAKNHALFFDPSGTIGGITFVRTRNGSHMRSPRGTFKKAECNNTLKAVNARNHIVNSAAKVVHDCIKAYERNFKQSNLWQVMVGRVRQSQRDDLLSLLKPLEGLEVNKDYALERIAPDTKVDVQTGNGVLTISLNALYNPWFDLPHDPRYYYYELHVLFINAKKTAIKTETINTGWIDMQQPRFVFEMAFEMPVMAAYYVVLLKVQGGDIKKAIEDHRSMGVKVVSVGKRLV